MRGERGRALSDHRLLLGGLDLPRRHAERLEHIGAERRADGDIGGVSAAPGQYASDSRHVVTGVEREPVSGLGPDQSFSSSSPALTTRRRIALKLHRGKLELMDHRKKEPEPTMIAGSATHRRKTILRSSRSPSRAIKRQSATGSSVLL